MTSFQDAFHQGLEASESAEHAQQEVESVFDECTKQVSEASRGALILSREPRTIASQQRDILLDKQRKLIADTVHELSARRRIRQVLVAHIADEPNTQGVELCEYSIPASGYPVSLVYTGVDEYCHDKSSLELALMELLRHPATGGKLRKLMDLHAKRAAGDAGIAAPANGHPGGEPK